MRSALGEQEEHHGIAVLLVGGERRSRVAGRQTGIQPEVANLDGVLWQERVLLSERLFRRRR